MLKLANADIYRIFYLWYTGRDLTNIGTEVGCNRDTVRAHLSLVYWHKYNESLQKRISLIYRPLKRTRSIPEGYITLEDVSYFLFRRPNARTIQENYRSIRTEIVNGLKLSKKEWVLDFVRRTESHRPHGIFLTPGAVAKLSGEKKGNKITRIGEVDLKSLPEDIISRSLAILEFTELHYLTLAEIDIESKSKPSRSF